MLSFFLFRALALARRGVFFLPWGKIYRFICQFLAFRSLLSMDSLCFFSSTVPSGYYASDGDSQAYILGFR